jgi:hypothetical protein
MSDERWCEWCTGGRRCGRAANREFSDLKLCWHHHLYLLDRIDQALILDPALVVRVRRTISEIDAVARRGKVEQRRSQPAFVYFAERDGFVKIGWGRNIPKRMKELGTGDSAIEGMRVGPVRLLAAIRGGEQKESSLHAQFAHLRIGGEWFLFEAEVCEFVDSLNGRRDDLSEFQDQIL